MIIVSDPENGNWLARWAALPLLWSRPAFAGNLAWNQGDVGRVSERFLYHSGNDSDRVMLQGPQHDGSGWRGSLFTYLHLFESIIWA